MSRPPAVPVAPGIAVQLVHFLRPGIDLPSARRLVLLHHGIGEHAGRYVTFAQRLLAATPTLDGVLSYDCRGHGLSATTKREICLVSGVDQLIDDFGKVFEYWLDVCAPEARFVLLGHSLGGLCVAAVAAAERSPVNGEAKGRIEGVVLSAPALKVFVSGVANKVIAPFAGIIAAMPGTRCIRKKSDISVTDLTKDEAEQQKFLDDPLNHDLVTIGLGADLLAHGSKIFAAVSADAKSELVCTTAPLLLVYGEDDHIVDAAGGEMLLQARPSGSSGKIVYISGAKHEPFNDDTRDEFYSTVAKFIHDDCATVLVA